MLYTYSGIPLQYGEYRIVVIMRGCDLRDTRSQLVIHPKFPK